MIIDLAVAVGLEPTMTGLTIQRLTNLATPQNISDLRFQIARMSDEL